MEGGQQQPGDYAEYDMYEVDGSMVVEASNSDDEAWNEECANEYYGED